MQVDLNQAVWWTLGHAWRMQLLIIFQSSSTTKNLYLWIVGLFRPVFSPFVCMSASTC